MEVKGRGVFLTGGAQGIGRALITVLLQHGAKVMFCDVKADTGKETEAELQKQFGADNVTFIQCDVTDTQQLKRAFSTAVSKFGAVEICVNNAGLLNERMWEKVIAINTVASIRGCQLALEHMRRDKGGRGGVIINIVSVAGYLSAFICPAYVASKHAVIGYALSCAADPSMPAMGVRWGCICPDVVNTSMVELQQDQDRDRVQNYEHAVKRFEDRMEPEVVAKAFMQMLQDVDSNGKLMVVTKEHGAVYKRRALVDEDGVSIFSLVDQSLDRHPPPPGHTQ